MGDRSKCIDALNELKRYFKVDLLDFEYRKSEICLKRNFDVETARKILKNFDVKILDSGFAYHIVDKKVNKGYALKFIAKKLGIDTRDFAVIGDSENDIEMFKVAGFGIAVANANEKLKIIADLVTPSSDGDGVVEALKFLNLI